MLHWLKVGSYATINALLHFVVKVSLIFLNVTLWERIYGSQQ